MPLLIQQQIGYRVRIKLAALDTNDALVTREASFEMTAATDAEAQTAAAAMAAAYGAISEADVYGYEWTKVFGSVSAIISTANPYKVAVMSLQPAVLGDRQIPHNVIAPADAVLTGGITVDPTNAVVIAYLAQFISTANFRLSDGEFLPDPPVITKSRVKSVASGKIY